MVLVLAQYSEGSEVQLLVEDHLLTHVAEYFRSEGGGVPEILAETYVEQSYIFQTCIKTFDDRLRLPSRQLEFSFLNNLSGIGRLRLPNRMFP